MSIVKNSLYANGAKFSPIIDASSQKVGEFNMENYVKYCLYSWVGKKVAFLGDSITEGANTERMYWEYLEDLIGIEATSYGISGAMWMPTDTHKDILTQAKSAVASGVAYDAIFVFCGTNDFYNNVPMGKWYNEEDYQTALTDRGVIKKRVLTSAADATEKGYINDAMKYIKQNYPNAQVIMMTPIHRGRCGDKALGSTYAADNEFASNKSLIYLSDFVNAVKEGAEIWSCPCINLYEDCGILSWMDEYGENYLNKKDDDRMSDSLHPNRAGHWRIAQTIASKLVSIPCGTFDLTK